MTLFCSAQPHDPICKRAACDEQPCLHQDAAALNLAKAFAACESASKRDPLSARKRGSDSYVERPG